MPKNIFAEFEKRVEEYPEKTALKISANALTYAELYRLASNLSANMSKQGVARGDHIGVLLPNSLEYVVLMLAVAKKGAVLVPHNLNLGLEAVERAFNSSDVKHFVCWHARIAEIMQRQMLPNDSGHLFVSVGKQVIGTSLLSKMMEEDVDWQPTEAKASDPYILTLTSGSTGQPKPIILSQETKIRRAHIAAEIYGVTDKDVTITSTPLYHSLAERLVLIPLLTGGTSVVMERFSPAAWLESVETNAVTFSILVSSQVKQVFSGLRPEAGLPESLACLVSSSERLPDEYKNTMKSYGKCQFHECYGASEIAIATDLKVGKGAPGTEHSVGVPVPGVAIRIIDTHGKPLEPGQIGEIACKTPFLFSGYYRQSEATHTCMADGYFRTGDLGKLDSEGYLYFVGRCGDTIKTGGINVYPRDVEEVLLSHQKVEDCAVVGLVDEWFGEIVTAVLVGDLETTKTLRELRLACLRDLADYQQPRRFFKANALHHTPMGKLDRKKVEDSVKSGLFEELQ